MPYYRNATRKLLVNTLPNSIVATSFVLFFIVLVASIACTLYAPHRNEKTIVKLDNSTVADISSILKGESLFQLEVHDYISTLNQELFFAIYLKSTKLLDTIYKSDFQIRVGLEGRNSDSENYQFVSGEDITSLSRLTSPESLRSRILNCPNKESYFCDAIPIFHERTIRYHYYRIKVQFWNLKSLIEKQLIDDTVISGYLEYTNANYTRFETALRAIFAVLSIFLFVFYFILLLWKQSWTYCRTEQRSLLFLLFGLILFNNPSFFLDWYSGAWFFPLINIIFIATFASIFVLFVLIVTHAALVKPKDRKFWLFYLPKIALVFLLWSCIVISFSFERFTQQKNSSFEVTELTFWSFVEYIILGLLGIIALIITYFAMRIFGEFQSIGLRYRYFILLTLLTVIASGLDMASYIVFDFANSAAQFLSLFPIFNFYAVVLVIYFAPSNQLEDEVQEKFISREEFDMHPVNEEEEDERASMLRSTQLQVDDDDDEEIDGEPKEEDLELQEHKSHSMQISAVEDDQIDENRYSLE